MRSIFASLMLLLAACGAGGDSPAQAEIRAVMMRDWNKPEAPLTVDPIVVVGSFAVADWTQPALGGRALLQRAGNSWNVVLCAGDALKDAGMLAHAGMTPADAEALLKTLAAAEAPLPAERLARIAAFKGVVRMEGGSHGESTQ
jgi:hypothetical protein